MKNPERIILENKKKAYYTIESLGSFLVLSKLKRKKLPFVLLKRDGVIQDVEIIAVKCKKPFEFSFLIKEHPMHWIDDKQCYYNSANEVFLFINQDYDD